MHNILFRFVFNLMNESKRLVLIEDKGQASTSTPLLLEILESLQSETISCNISMPPPSDHSAQISVC